MEMLLEQAIKNLEYMCNHSNLEHDRKSLRTVIKFVESYDERLKADMVAILEDLKTEIYEQQVKVKDSVDNGVNIGIWMVANMVQVKIDKLKGNKHGNKRARTPYQSIRKSSIIL